MRQLLFIFLFVYGSSTAQDSLLIALKTVTKESEGRDLAKLIISKCFKDEQCYKPYLDVILSNPLNDAKVQMISSITQTFYTNSQVPLSKKYLLQGVEFVKSNNLNHPKLGRYYNYLTMLYTDQNVLDSALHFAQLTADEFRKYEPSVALWTPNFNRYLIYLQLNDFAKADQYLKDAYNYVKTSTNRMDKGFVLYAMTRSAKERWGEKEFDKWLGEFLAFKKAGSPDKPIDLLHSGLLDLFDDKVEGLKKLEKRLAQLNKDSLDASSILTRFDVAEKYSQTGQLQKAVDQMDMLIKENPSLSRVQKSSYLIQYEYLKKMGQHQKALIALEKYTELQDSSFQQILDGKIADYEAKYQTQLKENELMKKDIELKDLKLDKTRLLSGGSFVLLLVFSGLMFYYRKLKFQKKINQKDQEISNQKILDLEQKNKLLALSSMIEGQESERLRIAQDLHDGLGGLLTSVKAHFNTITRELEAVSQINVFQKTNELIDEACGEVRRIAHDMIPHSLSEHGLQGVLTELSNTLENAGIKADIEVHYPLIKVPEHKASMIYRILQEVSQNTIKHANANHLLIQFFGDEKNLHILTEDNGIGFDVNTLINKKGMGLKSLESRVQYLEGQMDIDSKIGKGTTINMIIPIP